MVISIEIPCKICQSEGVQFEYPKDNKTTFHVILVNCFHLHAPAPDYEKFAIFDSFKLRTTSLEVRCRTLTYEFLEQFINFGCLDFSPNTVLFDYTDYEFNIVSGRETVASVLKAQPKEIYLENFKWGNSSELETDFAFFKIKMENFCYLQTTNLKGYNNLCIFDEEFNEIPEVIFKLKHDMNEVEKYFLEHYNFIHKTTVIEEIKEDKDFLLKASEQFVNLNVSSLVKCVIYVEIRKRSFMEICFYSNKRKNSVNVNNSCKRTKTNNQESRTNVNFENQARRIEQWVSESISFLESNPDESNTSIDERFIRDMRNITVNRPSELIEETHNDSVRVYHETSSTSEESIVTNRADNFEINNLNHRILNIIQHYENIQTMDRDNYSEYTVGEEHETDQEDLDQNETDNDYSSSQEDEQIKNGLDLMQQWFTEGMRDVINCDIRFPFPKQHQSYFQFYQKLTPKLKKKLRKYVFSTQQATKVNYNTIAIGYSDKNPKEFENYLERIKDNKKKNNRFFCRCR